MGVIHLLKIISTVGQAITPLLSFELTGFAAFLVAMAQNALIDIDNRRAPEVRETSPKD